jgi:hypothetical protein
MDENLLTLTLVFSSRASVFCFFPSLLFIFIRLHNNFTGLQYWLHNNRDCIYSYQILYNMRTASNSRVMACYLHIFHWKNKFNTGYITIWIAFTVTMQILYNMRTASNSRVMACYLLTFHWKKKSEILFVNTV